MDLSVAWHSADEHVIVKIMAYYKDLLLPDIRKRRCMQELEHVAAE